MCQSEEKNQQLEQFTSRGNTRTHAPPESDSLAFHTRQPSKEIRVQDSRYD